MASFAEQLQRIVRLYREDGQRWPASSRAVAAWAISQNLWQPQRENFDQSMRRTNLPCPT